MNATTPHLPLEIGRFDPVAPVDELLALTHAAFADPPIVPPSSVLRETADDFVRRLQTETCWVARSGPELVGSVFCARRDDALYIGRLAVRGDWRRRGVASALTEAALAQARAIGLARVTLSARIALPGNVALFRRFGFAIVAERCHPGFTQPTFYDMELRLTAA